MFKRFQETKRVYQSSSYPESLPTMALNNFLKNLFCEGGYMYISGPQSQTSKPGRSNEL